MEIPFEGKTYKLEDLSRDELLELKIKVQQARDDIAGQLERAKQDYIQHGKKTNLAWQGKANTAFRGMGRSIEKIQLELRRKRQDGNRSLEQSFIAVCKQRLNKDIFEEYMQEAKEGSEAIRDDQQGAGCE